MENLTNDTSVPVLRTKVKKVLKAKAKKAKKVVTAKPVATTKRTTVSVPVKEYTILATQDSTITGKGKNKTTSKANQYCITHSFSISTPFFDVS